MAAARPASRHEFAAISGVGQAKLDRYGDAFLDIITRHAAETEA
jgi:ATP-dependent DNA helicase RecQ